MGNHHFANARAKIGPSKNHQWLLNLEGIVDEAENVFMILRGLLNGGWGTKLASPMRGGWTSCASRHDAI